MKSIIYVIIIAKLMLTVVASELYSNDLKDYLKIATENNPGLQAKYSEYQSAQQRIPQAGALPDPQLSFGLFIEPMERYMGDQTADISLMQMFPWFGTLNAAKSQAELMAKAVLEKFKEAKSMLHYEVKTTWYLLYLLEQEIIIQEDTIDIFKTLEDIAVKRFRSGKTSGINPSRSNMDTDESMSVSTSAVMSGGMIGMDMQGQTSSFSRPPATSMGDMEDMSGNGKMVNVLRIRMEINELQNRLQMLKDKKITLTAKFNKLLYRHYEETILIPDMITTPELPLSAADIPDSIRTHNPMLKMLEEEKKAFGAMRKMNKRMGYPMIGVGLQYSVFETGSGYRSMMNGDNMLMPMITVTVPLRRKKYNASVREAELKREAVNRQKQDEIGELMVNYRKAVDNFKDAERRWVLYQEQAALGQQILDIITAEYSIGTGSFEDVLRMQPQLLNYRLKKLEAKVDGHIAAAMLERLMGK